MRAPPLLSPSHPPTDGCSTQVREARPALPAYFTVPRLRHIARQCLEALAFVHSLGIIHCDVKPENITIASYSRATVKIIDFGSSCFTSDHLSSYIQSRSYRAPEVILGLPYDGKIDVWSLGCVLAEMHTGYVLLQNDSVQTMLARMIGILGPVPARMLANGRDVPKFFVGRSSLIYERVQAQSGGGGGGRSLPPRHAPHDGLEEGEASGSEAPSPRRASCDPEGFEYLLVYPKRTTLARRLHFEALERSSRRARVPPGALDVDDDDEDAHLLLPRGAALLEGCIGRTLLIDPNERPRSVARARAAFGIGACVFRSRSLVSRTQPARARRSRTSGFTSPTTPTPRISNTAYDTWPPPVPSKVEIYRRCGCWRWCLRFQGITFPARRPQRPRSRRSQRS